MPKIITFLDTGVLIAGARGIAPLAAKAQALVDDPDREFVSSVFLELETRPRAIFNRRHLEDL